MASEHVRLDQYIARAVEGRSHVHIEQVKDMVAEMKKQKEMTSTYRRIEFYYSTRRIAFILKGMGWKPVGRGHYAKG